MLHPVNKKSSQIDSKLTRENVIVAYDQGGDNKGEACGQKVKGL